MSRQSSPRACVLHPHEPAVIVCIVSKRRNPGVVRDFCAECIQAGADDDNFGRCYLCDDEDHVHCIGVPCQCDCPVSPDDLRAARIAELRAELAVLEYVADRDGEG